jgi:hypothetical protein
MYLRIYYMYIIIVIITMIVHKNDILLYCYRQNVFDRFEYYIVLPPSRIAGRTDTVYEYNTIDLKPDISTYSCCRIVDPCVKLIVNRI